MTGKVTYLLPVETSARELDYKLLLAARLHAPHRRFIVCRDDLAPDLLGIVRNGIYIGQNIRSRAGAGKTNERYRRLRAAGFRLIHLDEEGAIYPGAEDEWEFWIRQRLGALGIEAPDAICAWGRFQSEVLARTPGVQPETVVTTGHPRLDLCNAFLGAYGEEVAALRREYGDFVLLNTNFGSGNSVLGTKTYFSAVEGYRPADTAQRLAYVRDWKLSACGAPAFVGLIHEICEEFPRHHFVLRPHPAEDHDLYRATTRGLKNVTVDARGNVIAYIAACRVMIHNGCTTAIEGHLAGTRVLSYCPPEIGRGSTWITSVFGLECTTPRAICEALAATVDSEVARPSEATARDRSRAATLLRQLEAGYVPGDALERVVGLAERMERGLGSGMASMPRLIVRGAALRHATRAEVFRRLERVARAVRPKGRLGIAQRNAQKFTGLSQEPFEVRANTFGALLGRNLAVQVLSPTLAIIE